MSIDEAAAICYGPEAMRQHREALAREQVEALFPPKSEPRYFPTLEAAIEAHRNEVNPRATVACGLLDGTIRLGESVEASRRPKPANRRCKCGEPCGDDFQCYQCARQDERERLC